MQSKKNEHRFKKEYFHIKLFYYNNYTEERIAFGDLKHKLRLWQVSDIHTKGQKNSNIKPHCIFYSHYY